MNNKGLILISVILMLFIISMSSVSAGELGTAEELTINEEMAIDNGDLDNLNEELDENTILEVNEELEQSDNPREKETLSDSNSYTVEDKTFSGIQTVVNSANAGDTITLDGTYSNDGDSAITVSKQISFMGINNATLDAAKLSNIFNISIDGVSFKNINFINGKNTGSGTYGGAIYGDCTIMNCTFKDNYVQHYGGAVYGNCYIADSTFINNIAFYQHGGAVYGNGTIVNCTFRDNFGDQEGGAVYGNYYVADSNFRNNTSNIGGAAICGGSALNCTFIRNYLKAYNPYFGGGAIYAGSAINCTFVNNSANRGGAICDGSALNCTFVNNSADIGGALCDSLAENCTFINNSANNGGAFYINTSMEYSLSNCGFINNSAKNMSGGAIWINSQGSVVNCSFVNNSAERYGGAIYCGNENTFTNCNFTGNRAYGNYQYGGAVCIGSDNTFTNCNFSNNSARFGGAIFENHYRNTTIIGCSFVNNSGASDSSVFDPSKVEYSIVNSTFVYERVSIGRGSVVNCSFENCSYITLSGESVVGASYVASVEGCSFLNNSRIVIQGGPLTNCSFVNNSVNNVDDRRAPILIFDSNYNKGLCSVVDCTFVNNSATTGGAIYWAAEDGTISNCNFINNSASGSGGAIYWIAENGTISNCNFTNNSAADSGGAIYLDNNSNSVTISNSDFRNNSVSNSYLGVNRGGGAICLIGNGIHIKLCSFISNLAKYSNGGALFLNTTGLSNTLGNNNLLASNALSAVDINNMIEQSTFQGNEAYNGTAIYTEDDANIVFNNFFYIEDTELEKLVAGMTLDQLSTNDFTKTKLNATVNSSDIRVTYGENIIGSVSSVNAKGISVVIYDKNNMVVYTKEINPNSDFVVPILAVGTYTANFTTIIEEGLYIPSSCKTTITINPAKSTVSSSAVSSYYGKTFSVSVKSNNATSIKYTIKNSTGSVVKSGTINPGQSITSLKFAPGTYTLSLTAVVDANHTSSSASSKITVNKATANITAKALTTYYSSGKTWSITLKDTTNNKLLSKAKLTLKVYTGKKYKTYTATTNDKGFATFKASTLAAGTHKVVVSYSNKNYNCKSLTSSLKINKMGLTYKITKSTQKDGAGLHILVKNKATGKLVNKMKIKLRVYTGKKYKQYTLTSAKYGNKGNGYAGFAVKGPVFNVGTHTVKILAGDSNHAGTVSSKLFLKKTVKKYGKKTIIISNGKRTVK